MPQTYHCFPCESLRVVSTKVVAIQLLQVHHGANLPGFKDRVAFCYTICITDQRNCLEMEFDYGLYLDAAACSQLS